MLVLFVAECVDRSLNLTSATQLEYAGVFLYSVRMILLYPTETVYGLGVNAFDKDAMNALYTLKTRDESKPVSWLVRNTDDVKMYAHMSEKAAKIAERFLPGPLTLVLPVRKESVPAHITDAYIGFRISSHPVAQQIIAHSMEEDKSPLTCTSANVSGLPTLNTPTDILEQFGDKRDMIDVVYDVGPLDGMPSTVIKVEGNELTLLREGAIPFADIEAVK